MSDATENLKTHLVLARARFELLKAKQMSGGYSRHPSGSSKGGQFAPKGSSSGGGQSDVSPPKSGGNTFVEVGGPGWGSYEKPKGPPPGAKPHAAGVDDKGKPVTINYPTKQSGKDTWNNKNETATFTPGGDAPSTLNGVAMKPWSPPKEGWSAVGGNNERLEAVFPFQRPTDGKSIGAGVLIMESDGRIWLTKPTNQFGGYKQTYPKGTVESGLTMQQNAIKEAFEETGLKIKITGVLGDYDRTTSRARMYLAERVGGTPKDMGWESQAVRLATMKDAKTLLNMSHDKNILDDAQELLDFSKAKGGSWQNQLRWPGGTPLGGQWRAMGADGLTTPPLIAGGLTGKNSVYQKAVDAAHAGAQKGDLGPANQLLSKYAPKLSSFNSGVKSSSHIKWGAQCAQYGNQLLTDALSKPVAVAAADRITGPKMLSSYGASVGPKPGGSNPGAMYAEKGDKWLVKGSNAAANQDAKTIEDRSKNEVLAAKLMLAAGVGAPEMKLVELEGQYGGGVGVASKMIDGLSKLQPNSAGHVSAAGQDFAVHAWLANYDALGQVLDNTMIKDGKAYNIDTGGALLFRAQGAKKELSANGGVLDPSAPEFESMRNTTSEQVAVYGKMTSSDLKASAEKLNNISDDTIRSLVKTYGPGNEAFKDKLAQNLIDRKKAVLNKAGVPLSTASGIGAAQQAVDTKPAATKEELQAIVVAGAMKNVDLAMKSMTILASSGYPGPKVTAPSAGSLVKSGDSFIKNFAEKIDVAHLTGDLTGLAMSKAGLDEFTANVKGTPAVMADIKALGDHTNQAMKAAAYDAAKSAMAIAEAAPKVNIPTKPNFPNGETAAAYYNNLVDSAEKAFVAGNLSALKSIATKSNGAPSWPTKTANGKAMDVWHKALVEKLEQKDASTVMARVNQAHAAVSKPVSVPTLAQAAQTTLPAMPNFADQKIAPSNKNAGSHNSKVDVIKGLAEKGDVNGLISLGYGVNTYGKKQAALVNSALAALGSAHVVTPGQKAGQHLALFGGVTAAQATAAAAKLNVSLPPSSDAPKQSAKAVKEATTKKEDWLKLKAGEKVVEQGEQFGVQWAKIQTPAKGFKPEDIPAKPDFFSNGNLGPTNTWKSSKQEVNEANNQAVKLIYDAAISGNGVEALNGLTFNVNGKQVTIKDHPAAGVKEYYEQAKSELAAQLRPGYKSVQSGSFTGAYAKAAEVLASDHASIPYTSFKNATRAADYVVLSKDGASSLPVPQAGAFKEITANSKMNNDLKQASDAAFAALSTSEKAAAKSYTGGGYDAWNGALRTGATQSASFESAQPLVNAFKKAAVDLPEGSILWRGLNVGQSTYESVVGGVIQDGSFNSASYGDYPAFSSKPTWLRIHVPKTGVKAVHATSFSNYGTGEREIIIQNGVRYAVLKVQHHKVYKTTSGKSFQNKTIVDVIALPHI